MRVVHGFLRLPFPLFAGLAAVVLGGAYFVLSVAVTDAFSIWLVIALVGFLLLARDWSKKQESRR
jgi:hypothetical protein